MVSTLSRYGGDEMSNEPRIYVHTGKRGNFRGLSIPEQEI
jgi:hypothetical protein